MTIPGYQEIMLPFLKALSDQQPHRLADMHDLLAARFGLTAEERNQLLPSGRQSKFENRVGWARTYLKKAGLLDTPSRGICLISPAGLRAIDENQHSIDLSYLQQFPSFVEFQQRSGRKVTARTETYETPEELLETVYLQLEEQLADEVLTLVKACSPAFFERLVVQLLVSMGYGGSIRDAGEAIGRSGDGGIDGIIKEDKLGLDAIYVQAKRWDGTVGRPVVQGFVGSLEGHHASKGVLLSTSTFSSEARDFVSRIGKKVVLIDGPLLARLMIEHGLGVNTVAAYQVKRPDKDYFSGELASAAD